MDSSGLIGLLTRSSAVLACDGFIIVYQCVRSPVEFYWHLPAEGGTLLLAVGLVAT